MDRRLGEEKQINKMMAVQETDEFVAERERERETQGAQAPRTLVSNSRSSLEKRFGTNL